MIRVAPTLAVLLLLVACGSDTEEPTPAQLPYETLSEYGFFEGPLADQAPADGVLAYAPVSPLWADYAEKGRYIVLPEGETIDPEGDEDWVYPLGSIIVKSFYFVEDRRDLAGPARIMETRLLIREDVEEGWTSHTYVWNDEQTEAERVIAGRRISLAYTDEDGGSAEQIYLVPNTNQCRDCHGREDVTVLLGINTYQLDYEVGGANQLDVLVDAGAFSRRPERTVPALVDPAEDSNTPELRARSYLHANCSHCHRPGGDGGRSGLDLRIWQEDPARYGVCKTPVAAGAGAGGRSYDLVPRHPELSILPFRMASTDPEVRMPELPSRVPDDFGVELIEEWILSMDAEGCE
ncbi:MAG: putative repeat protein (TIGR03806 family) [Bradymonadia bacterium]|jgi:uncharacterized repeat protein (TIGR03806 family)